MTARHPGRPSFAVDVAAVSRALTGPEGNAKTAGERKSFRSREIVFHGTADAIVHPLNGEPVFDATRSDVGGHQELTSDIRSTASE